MYQFLSIKAFRLSDESGNPLVEVRQTYLHISSAVASVELSNLFDFLIERIPSDHEVVSFSVKRL